MSDPSDERTASAEAILDRIFTPSWREHGGGVARESAAGRDFARLCVEHCYADAWARSDADGSGRLDMRTRSLVTLAALAALGATEELKLHVRGALNLGHEPDDVVELFIQLLPYLGVPRMVQAMRLAGEVFSEA
jgi:alkylhydroperoxidase/carboxymuconolactone decarboxylase family protein YurZ